MVGRRERGAEDQVGRPSPAGPSILEPARGREAENGVTDGPAALMWVPQCPPVGLLTPGAVTGRTPLSPLVTPSHSRHPPPHAGEPGRPQTCPTTLLWPHGPQRGELQARGE